MITIKTKISDKELLRALGYEEDNSPKYSDAVEATVAFFKKHILKSKSKAPK